MGEIGHDTAGASGVVSFRVLGPVELLRDGVPVPLPEGQLAQLLGVLLAHAGMLVPVDTLMAALWTADPPASSRKLLQVRMSRLRTLLAGTTAVLEGSRSGYRLDVPPGSLDLAEFHDLVAAARDREPAGAADLLAAALRLWRTPPPGRFGDTVAGQRMAAALDAERVAAVEAHADAALAAGRPQDAVDGVTAALADHPLRESLRARLLPALAATGRQAEALAVFDEGRRLLADELGVDPGAELRAAHAAVLAGQPTPPVRAGQAPRELPVAAARFVGREREIEALLAAVREPAAGPAVVAVHGPGGQGKSALVLRVAQQLTAEFPDGQLYVDLLGSTPGTLPLTPGDVLRRFLRALDVPLPAIPDDPAAAAALYRSTVAGRRLLVVLDNAVDGAQVRPLVPAGAGAAALITSRRRLATVEAGQVALPPLPEDDAIELLVRYSGRPRSSFLDDDKDSVASIALACDHQPLALRIAAARLSSRPDWTAALLAARLTDERHRLDELHFDDLAVRSSVEIGYRDLPPDAARALRLLGLLHLPWLDRRLVAALLGVDDAGADRLLDPLVRDALVDVPAPGRYQVHDLVRLFAEEQAARHESDEARAAALTRAFEHYVRRLTAAHARLRPHSHAALRDPADDEDDEFADIAACVRWISEQTDNLLAAARLAADSPRLSPYALDIAERMYSYLWKQDLRADLVEVGRIATTAARHIGTEEAVEKATQIRAAVHRRLDRPEQAHAEYAAVVASRRRRGDLFGQGRGLTNVGIALQDLGRLAEAVVCFEESAELVRRHGPPGADRVALCCLAQVHQRAGDHEQARDRARESLARSREHEDPTGAAYALAVAGQALTCLGELAAAEEALDECVALCRQTGERHDEWEARLTRSQTRLRNGDAVGAAEDARLVLELLGEHGDTYGRGAAHRQLARVARLRGEPAAARHETTAAALLGSVAADELLEGILGSPAR